MFNLGGFTELDAQIKLIEDDTQLKVSKNQMITNNLLQIKSYINHNENKIENIYNLLLFIKIRQFFTASHRNTSMAIFKCISLFFHSKWKLRKTQFLI